MTRTAKLSVTLFLIVALGALSWRLWPDGRQARRQQRSNDLVRAVQMNDLNAAVRLLNEGADPNARAMPLSLIQRAEWDYAELSHGRRPLTGKRMEDMNPPWSVLEIAVTNDKVSMVKALLSKGADVGYRDKMGSTSLSLGQMLSGGSVRASGTHDQNLILALLKAAEARRTAP